MAGGGGMTDGQIVQLLIQVPLVGLFAWFVLKLNAQAREDRQQFLDILNGELSRLTEAVVKLSENIDRQTALLDKRLSELERRDEKWTR